VIAVLTDLYAQALKHVQPVIFSRIAQLCVHFKNYRRETAAIDLETVANAKLTSIRKRSEWRIDYAGELYRRVGDQEGEQRCQLGAVRQFLKDAR